MLKSYTFSRERESEICLGQIVVCCAGFESGEVVEFGKVPMPEGFWPLHYLFQNCADIFKTDAEFITYNLVLVEDV